MVCVTHQKPISMPQVGQVPIISHSHFKQQRVGSGMGNPGVSPGLPVPLPMETCTHTHRYRLVAGRGRGFDGLYSTKPHGGKTHGFSMLQWRCEGAGGRFPSINIEIEGQEGAGGRFLPPALKSRGRREQE